MDILEGSSSSGMVGRLVTLPITADPFFRADMLPAATVECSTFYYISCNLLIINVYETVAPHT